MGRRRLAVRRRADLALRTCRLREPQWLGLGCPDRRDRNDARQHGPGQKDSSDFAHDLSPKVLDPLMAPNSNVCLDNFAHIRKTAMRRMGPDAT
jgi:hypothetical protein